MKKYSLLNYIVGAVIIIIAFTILFSKSKSGFRGGSMGGGSHGSIGGGSHGGHGGHGSHGSHRGWGASYGGDGGWGWNDGLAVEWPVVVINQDSGAGCLQDFERCFGTP